MFLEKSINFCRRLILLYNFYLSHHHSEPLACAIFLLPSIPLQVTNPDICLTLWLEMDRVAFPRRSAGWKLQLAIAGGGKDPRRASSGFPLQDNAKFHVSSLAPKHGKHAIWIPTRLFCWYCTLCNSWKTIKVCKIILRLQNKLRFASAMSLPGN